MNTRMVKVMDTMVSCQVKPPSSSSFSLSHHYQDHHQTSWALTGEKVMNKSSSLENKSNSSLLNNDDILNTIIRLSSWVIMKIITLSRLSSGALAGEKVMNKSSSLENESSSLSHHEDGDIVKTIVRLSWALKGDEKIIFTWGWV